MPDPAPAQSANAQWETLAHRTQDQLDAMTDLHARVLAGRLGGRRIFLKNSNLAGLSIAGRNLRQAQFMGCMMREMDVSGTDFSEGALYACDLSHANLAGASFLRADLRGTRIENANLKGADLEKADLRAGGIAGDGGPVVQPQPVNFAGANLAGAKLVGSMAGRADFSDAILTGADMRQADLRDAQLEGADLSGAEIQGAEMEGANLKSAILTGIDQAALEAAHMDTRQAITDTNVGQNVLDLDRPLVEMIADHRRWVETAGEAGRQLDLSHVDMRFLKSLDREKLTAMRALTAKFFGMSLTDVELQSAVLDGSDFRNCDMTAADLRGASLKGCNLSHAIVRRMNGAPLLFGEGRAVRRFAPCNLEGAVARYADFSGAMLKAASFRGADLSYADFSGADLREADFAGANLHAAKLDGAQVEGAHFDRGGGPAAFRLGALREEAGEQDG